MTMSSSRIFGNQAGNGAVIVSPSGDIFISDCIFTDNKATIGRGGVFFLGSPMKKNRVWQITNSTFQNNKALMFGAVLWFEMAMDIAIDSCTFTDNKATFDQAISLVDCKTFRMANTNFISDKFSPHDTKYIYIDNGTPTYRTYHIRLTFGNFSIISSDSNFSSYFHDGMKRLETPYAAGKLS